MLDAACIQRANVGNIPISTSQRSKRRITLHIGPQTTSISVCKYLTWGRIRVIIGAVCKVAVRLTKLEFTTVLHAISRLSIPASSHI